MKMVPLYLLTCVLAAASIMYELIIANTIAGIAASSVVWYSLTIGLYLLFMGIGSFFSERAERKHSLPRTLFYTELLLVIVGGLSVIVLHFAHMLHVFFLVQNMNLLSAVIFPATAFSLIALIGFLTGIELPLLIRWGNKRAKADVSNRVLASDYIGSLAGALLVPIILIPFFSDIHAGFITALINLFAAIVVVFFSIKKTSVTAGLLTGALTSFLIICIFYASSFETYFVNKYYHYDEARTSLVDFITPSVTIPVQHTTSPYQRIDILQTPDSTYRLLLNQIYSSKFDADPSYPLGVHLFLNGDFQVLSNTDDIYHEWFAHYPIIINDEIPQSVLVLGGGDGLLDKELLKYKEIESITHVELDQEMLRLATTDSRLSRMNQGALSDPRVQVIVGDAYTYVKNSKETFDAIYVDFPYAQDYNLARLYSREFYSFAAKRLSENGFIVFDAPGSDLYTDPETGEIVYLGKNWYISHNTLSSAGFNTIHTYASILEHNNKEAFDALDALDFPVKHPDGSLVKGTPEEIEAHEHDSIRKALVMYAESSNQPFIFAKKEASEINKDWVQHDVTLHVLNKERFDLSKNLPYPTPTSIDPAFVNSIMRPVFDSSITWRLRRPY